MSSPFEQLVAETIKEDAVAVHHGADGTIDAVALDTQHTGHVDAVAQINPDGSINDLIHVNAAGQVDAAIYSSHHDGHLDMVAFDADHSGTIDAVAHVGADGVPDAVAYSSHHDGHIDYVAFDAHHTGHIDTVDHVNPDGSLTPVDPGMGSTGGTDANYHPGANDDHLTPAPEPVHDDPTSHTFDNSADYHHV